MHFLKENRVKNVKFKSGRFEGFSPKGFPFVYNSRLIDTYMGLRHLIRKMKYQSINSTTIFLG